MTEMINEGGEAYLFIFIIGGALFMMVWMFLSDPGRFLKSIFKDFIKDMTEKKMFGKDTEGEKQDGNDGKGTGKDEG